MSGEENHWVRKVLEHPTGDLNQVVTELNHFLGDRTSVGDRVGSDSDRELAMSLHAYILNLSTEDEEKRFSCADVCRWFDLVQHTQGWPKETIPLSLDVQSERVIAKLAEAEGRGNNPPGIAKSSLSPEEEAAERERKAAAKRAEKEAKKAAKKEKAAASPTATAREETKPGADEQDGESATRLDIRVANIISADRHPDAESLYVEQIDVGDESPRTVCSGLVKYIPDPASLVGPCMVICNLKPANMRGIRSEAMVLCATSEDGSTVELVKPPAGAKVGSRVTYPGHTGTPDDILNPKKKIFEKVAPFLITDDQGVATWKGIPWTLPEGLCTTTLPRALIK
mmetsp:Transcript_6948/g.14399  ORF Transcript_6948/g.14399 Transcript_6948/m.14399 type:complete len:341 (+) Transcript_6948:174-1196(+)